jgi:hypothetical protein
MTQLADQIDQAAGALGSGVTAETGELWKKTFGSQNDLTRIRAEYNRIVTPAAMAAYKQVASGSTSDKDIDTAMTGVPKDTDSPERMSSFLRGAAKLQVYDSVLNNAKSEWLGAVRSLGKAPKDIEVDGVRVPAGTTFKDFADKYVEAKATDKIAAMTLQGRSYMRWAQPQQDASAPAAPAAPQQPQQPGMLDELVAHPAVQRFLQLGQDYSTPEGKAALRARVDEAKRGGAPLTEVEALRARQAGLAQ